MIKNLDQFKVIQDQLKNGTELCPGQTSTSKSSCFNVFLKKTKGQFTTDIVLWSSLTIGAALLDKEKKNLPVDAAKAWILENNLVILEGVDLNHFYLAQFPAGAEADKLRQGEEKQLKKAKEKILGLAESALKDLSALPSQASRIDYYRRRIQAVQAKPWVFKASPSNN